jgi:hypothetical protein
VLSAANPVGLVYPAPPDTRAFLPTFGPDADQFLHGEALVNRVYTPYPREFYRDISSNIETFYPSFLTYNHLTCIGTALQINSNLSLPDCPSFLADFNTYMPVVRHINKGTRYAPQHFAKEESSPRNTDQANAVFTPRTEAEFDRRQLRQ